MVHNASIRFNQCIPYGLAGPPTALACSRVLAAAKLSDGAFPVSVGRSWIEMYNDVHI